MAGSSPINTQSGAAQWRIHYYPRVTLGGLSVPNYFECFRTSGTAPEDTFDGASVPFSDATELALTPATPGTYPTPLVISAAEQFQDARVTVSRDQFEHRTQISSKAVKFIITGIEMMAELSIASITPEQIGLLFSTPVGTSATAIAPSTIAPKYSIIKDNAGQELYGELVRIIPYVGASVSTEPNEYISMLNAAPVDINATDLTFGLETQRNLRITFYALPFYVFNPGDPAQYSPAAQINTARVVFGPLPAEATGLEEGFDENPIAGSVGGGGAGGGGGGGGGTVVSYAGPLSFSTTTATRNTAAPATTTITLVNVQKTATTTTGTARYNLVVGGSISSSAYSIQGGTGPRTFTGVNQSIVIEVGSGGALPNGTIELTLQPVSPSDPGANTTFIFTMSA